MLGETDSGTKVQPQRSGHDESSNKSTNNHTPVDNAICGALLCAMAQEHYSQSKRGVHCNEKYRKRVVINQGTAPRLVQKSEGTASRKIPVGVHVIGSRCKNCQRVGGNECRKIATRGGLQGAKLIGRGGRIANNQQDAGHNHRTEQSDNDGLYPRGAIPAAKKNHNIILGLNSPECRQMVAKM